jgi:serine/threonine-protein kinase
MGQLDHKNVIRQYESGEIGEGFYILMEYCRGGSVDGLMQKSGGKLSLEKATGIILQALEGLIYTHGVGIRATLGNGENVCHDGVVHRDFKPHNIFLSDGTDKAVAKVADFGLAKAFEASGQTGITATGAVAGTMAFMPRQQYLDYRYAEPQVDVWAAAASYYYMLTGCFPRNFNGMLPHVAILKNSAVPIRERDPGIPKSLADVIDRALIDNPAIVTKSASDLKKQIEQAVQKKG